MNGYLLDTNHVGAAIAPVSPIRDRMVQVNRSGIRLGTCIPVLCELEAGIQGHRRADSLRHSLRRLRSQVSIWPLDLADARLYGQFFLELRRRGRSLSQVDIMLAALANRMKLTVLTTDRDFEALPDIRTENWLSTC